MLSLNSRWPRTPQCVLKATAALGCVARLADPCLTAGRSICWKQPSNEPTAPHTHTLTRAGKGVSQLLPEPLIYCQPGVLAHPGQNLFTRRELTQVTLHSKNKWWDLAQIQSLLTIKSHNVTILSPSSLLNRLYKYFKFKRIHTVSHKAIILYSKTQMCDCLYYCKKCIIAQSIFYIYKFDIYYMHGILT